MTVLATRPIVVRLPARAKGDHAILAGGTLPIASVADPTLYAMDLTGRSGVDDRNRPRANLYGRQD